MAGFELIPAIDLRAGRCVRLFQGDFERETVFGDDPVVMARRWEALGATRLHVVDLDGARSGAPVQVRIIERIVRAVGIPVQLGGGLRSPEDLERAIEIGVDRVVLGTAAIGSPDAIAAEAFRRSCLERFGQRVVIGLDARDGKLAVRAWSEDTAMDAFELGQQLADEGFPRVVYTDISRDGALVGPNLGHVRRLCEIPGLAVIASGGVGRLEDLVALSESGAEAAIVGQALYNGALQLRAALEHLGTRSAPA